MVVFSFGSAARVAATAKNSSAKSLGWRGPYWRGGSAIKGRRSLKGRTAQHYRFVIICRKMRPSDQTNEANKARAAWYRIWCCNTPLAPHCRSLAPSLWRFAVVARKARDHPPAKFAEKNNFTITLGTGCRTKTMHPDLGVSPSPPIEEKNEYS